jgi:hypothetical protein
VGHRALGARRTRVVEHPEDLVLQVVDAHE